MNPFADEELMSAHSRVPHYNDVANPLTAGVEIDVKL
jgi:hypothetical protein